MRTAAALLLAATLPLFGQTAEGDRHYAGRAAGAEGARAAAAPVDAAIAAYSRAVAANQNDLEAQWKLLRAYRFKGAYVAASPEEKKKVYAAAKVAGEKALAALSRQLAGRGVDAARAKEAQLAAAVRAIPGAADLYLWDAINWGEWALAYGKLAAAREGAADRIRRQATVALLVDPRIEDGAPGRVLGRLHDQTPRIPFVTGWASGSDAIRFLEGSLAVAPRNKLTALFLAEALVSKDPRSKARAVQLLRGVIGSPDHEEFAVEDAAAVADARRLLARLQ